MGAEAFGCVLHRMVRRLHWKVIVIPEEMQQGLQPHSHALACMHKRGMFVFTRMGSLGFSRMPKRQTRCDMKRIVAYLSWVAGSSFKMSSAISW